MQLTHSLYKRNFDENTREWITGLIRIQTTTDHNVDWNTVKSGNIKGKLNPKTDFSSFEHLGLVEQLYEVFLSC